MECLEIKNQNPSRIPVSFLELQRAAENGIYRSGIFVLGIDYADAALMLLEDFHIKPDGIIKTPVDRVMADKYPDAKDFDTLHTLDDMAIIVGFTWNRNAGFLQEICSLPNVKAVYILEGAEYAYTMMFAPDKGLFRDHPKLHFVDSYYKGILQRGLTYSYFSSHRQEFEQTYQWLADDLSRKTMIAFLNGHVNLHTFPMDDVKDVSPQYFAADIIKLSDYETFVDCGGYDGDSVKEFVHQTNGKFNKIYVFEPDTKMLPNLEDRIKDLDNCVIFPKGTFNQTGVIGFNNEGCGMITNNPSDNTIETVQLDDVVVDEVTFIKMDIEGAELAALEGAKKLIEQYRPKLAVCVYHRREDLITIPQLIRSMFSGYKFYLRGYFSYVSEVVLYAIPAET